MQPTNTYEYVMKSQALHHGACWEDKRQHVEGGKEVHPDHKEKIAQPSIGTGHPERLCSLSPWRFSKFDWINS